MIYFIGGAPRVGKSSLTQRLAAKLQIGWISTDLLIDILRTKGDVTIKQQWDAAPEAIKAAAEFFFPYLERFVWGVNSMADSYIIEGVDFLPTQIAQIAVRYATRSLFLGCSQLTLEQFDQFPGRSHGYAALPEELRRQIVQDVPPWSDFVRQEAQQFDYPYLDMRGDFSSRLQEAETILTEGNN
ncbi:MAG: hypothetical protein U0175_28705 [Caldilineaceae bacterium]